MKNFRKNLASNITLLVALLCSVAYLIVLIVNTFKETPKMFYDGFSYLTAYIIVIVSLVLYLVCFFILGIARLKIPSWFQSVFYVAFFIFTNIFYITNAYTNLTAIVFLFAYISLISTVINVSIFYHAQKDEKNRLIASKKYIITSIFFYSTGTNAILEILITLAKVWFAPNYVFTKLSAFLVESITMLIVTIIICVVFYISLSKKKRIINSCLIKVGKKKN